MDKVKAQAYDKVRGDEWTDTKVLQPGDEATGSFPGCQWWIRDAADISAHAINIKVTGRPRWHDLTEMWRSRCRIEFVGHGEPSVYVSGWYYHSHI